MNVMRNGGASLEILNVTWSGCVNVNDFCYNQEKFIFISHTVLVLHFNKGKETVIQMQVDKTTELIMVAKQQCSNDQLFSYCSVWEIA